MIMSELQPPHLIFADPEVQDPGATDFGCCPKELFPCGFVVFVLAVARVGSGEGA